MHFTHQYNMEDWLYGQPSTVSSLVHFTCHCNRFSVITNTITVYVNTSVPTRHAVLMRLVDSDFVKRLDCTYML